jgi:hypothetical protein
MEAFWATVIGASVTGVCGIIAGLITMIIQYNSTKKMLEYRMGGVEQDIKEIKDTLAPSLSILERELAIVKEKISVMERDIEALKKKEDDRK